MISCRDWWPWTKPGLYHYDPETKQKSMGWLHSGSPRSKKFQEQKFPRKVLASIFWDQDDILHIEYFQRAKLSTRSITHLCWCNWRSFWRINAGRGKGTKGVLFFHYNDPANHAIVTQKKLAYLGSHCLDHPPYSPYLAPSHYHLFPGLKITIEKSSFFFRRAIHCCRRDLVGRAEFWFFFEWLAKLEQRAKKGIELREEYVE